MIAITRYSDLEIGIVVPLMLWMSKKKEFFKIHILKRGSNRNLKIHIGN